MDSSSSNELITQYHINTVTHKVAPNEWCENVSIDEKSTIIQIDTGAAQSLLPYSIFLPLAPKKYLVESDRQFQPYTHHPIKVGYVKLTTSYKNQSAVIKYYVLETEQKPIRSGRASESKQQTKSSGK